MSLRDARIEHTRKLCKLVLWAALQGYDLAFDESRVVKQRKVRKLGMTFLAEDAVHMPGSLHYLGLAADLNLYIKGEWISDGGHPAWTLIGAKWEEMGGAWGGRFKGVDSNHFSLAFGGKA